MSVFALKRAPSGCGICCRGSTASVPVIYTDDWEAYGAVLPQKRHRVVSKKSGKTSYIERFNNTSRQRVSRFVRRSLAFSKSLCNHVCLLWNFIHHYNALLPL